MKKVNLLGRILMAVMLFVLPVAGAIAAVFNAPIALAVGGATALHYIVEKFGSKDVLKGITPMLVTKEIWVNDITDSLFKNNQFLQYALNHDMYVLAGKVVHIPQAGLPSNVVKNRSSLPATVTKRTDSELLYNLEEFTSDPRLIANAEEVELSYDKRNDAMGEDKRALSETVADTMLISWAPATATTIRTSGAATAARMAGQTGTRLAFTEGDLRKAMTLFNAQNVPLEERYCLVDAYMYDDLIASLTITAARDFSKSYNQEKGILGTIHGFNIMMRSNTLVYNAAATAVNAYGAAVAVTDNCAALCWSKYSVCRALGEIKMFDQNDAPQYYGSIYSFLLRMGGRIYRADGKGVVAIAQA
jgi:hypothetical protein